MAVGMLVQIPGGTREFYDSVMKHLQWDEREKPRGLISHYAGAAGGDWVVFDVWESRADFERFMQERLGGAVAAAAGGAPPPMEPTFVDIHREEHARG